MASKVVIKDPKHKGNVSRMAIALKQVAGKIDTNPEGLYNQRFTLRSGDVVIKNTEIDMEFSIPFDDDTEANEAEIIIYNLTSTTINAISPDGPIRLTAGYGKDTGVIFSGYISRKRTFWENGSRKTVINAIDHNGKRESELSNLSFGEGTNASMILRRLLEETGLPIAVFEVRRDYTYKDKVSVDGGLMENIKKYAGICGIVAYMCKSQIYACPLSYGEHDRFQLSADTGLLNVIEFEEQSTNEDYTDTITGLEVEMLLQHRVQTGSILHVDTKQVKGDFRVKSGNHTYDGASFKTTVKAISYSCILK